MIDVENENPDTAILYLIADSGTGNIRETLLMSRWRAAGQNLSH